MKIFEMKKDGLTGDNLAFAEKMEAALDAAFDKAAKQIPDQTEVDRLIAKAMEGKGLTPEQEKSIMDTAASVRQIAIDVDKIKAHGVETSEETLEDTLKAAKDELLSIKRNGTGMKSFVLNANKAAGIHTTATTGSTRAITDSVSDFTSQRIPGGAMNLIMRPKPFILDFVNVGQTDSAVLIWWDEVAKEGDFAVTAEGVLKPMVQYRFERKSADYKKGAGYSVMTDEFDRDFPGLVTLIKRLMQQDCRLKIGDIVLTDLLAAVSTFTYTGLNASIDNADNYAAIAAVIAQKQSFYFDGPNVLFLNQADAVKMRFTKASDGTYIMPPADWGVDAIIIDPRITAGTFVVGDLSMFNVDFYGPVIVKIGYVNDDLIKNQYTVVVEQFFYDYISTNKKPAIVKGTFSTIKTALETA